MTLPSSGNISFSQIISEYDAQVNLFTTPGSSTINIPSTARAVIIETWGGGGSGGTSYSQYVPGDGTTVTYDGSGGGSGQYGYVYIPLSGDSGKTVSYTVGVGGDGTVQSSDIQANTTTNYFKSGGSSSASVTVTAGSYSLIAVGGVGAYTANGTSGGHATGSTGLGPGGGIGTDYAGRNATGAGTATGTGSFLVNGKNGVGGRLKEAGTEPGGAAIQGSNSYARVSYGAGGVGNGLGSGGIGRAGSNGAVQITFIGVPTHNNLTSYVKGLGLVPAHASNANIIATTPSTGTPLKVSQFYSSSSDFQAAITSGTITGATRYWGYRSTGTTIGSISKSAIGFTRANQTATLANLYEMQTSSLGTPTGNFLYLQVVSTTANLTSAFTTVAQTNSDVWVTYTGLTFSSAGAPTVGHYFTVSGCTPTTFNGTYICVASTSTSITLNYVDNDVSASALTTPGSIVDITYSYALFESVTVNGTTYHIKTASQPGGANATGLLSWYWTLTTQTLGTSATGLNTNQNITIKIL